MYIKCWFTAKSAIKVPCYDFLLLKELHIYAEIKGKISTSVLKKFINRLWNLSKEAITFAFFDWDVPIERKKKKEILKKLNDEDDSSDKDVDEEEEYKYRGDHRKFPLKFSMIEAVYQRNIQQFVKLATKNFFRRFQIDTSFVQKP